MQTEREVHSKEFQSQMFVNCFNECVTGAAAFNNANLTANEGKCLKSCYINSAKRLELAGKTMGFDCKLVHNFDQWWIDENKIRPNMTQNGRKKQLIDRRTQKFLISWAWGPLSHHLERSSYIEKRRCDCLYFSFI